MRMSEDRGDEPCPLPTISPCVEPWSPPRQRSGRRGSTDRSQRLRCGEPYSFGSSDLRGFRKIRGRSPRRLAIGRWAIRALTTRRIQRALQPAPYARAVATVDVTELALEIGFLAGHDAVADDEREGHQHHQQPEVVERDRQAYQT